MAERTLVTLFWLALGLGAYSLSPAAAADDKVPVATKAQEPKAADHATAGDDHSRAGGDATNPSLREAIVWPGMTRAGTIVLPNGWSLKPAGRQTRVGDLPVQIALHPSEPILAILHAGYGEHEVVTVHADNGRIIGRVSVPTSFSGLTWSADGKKLFVGGGFDDLIYRFDHAEGLLSHKAAFEYPDRKTFLAEANPRLGGGTRKHQRVPAGLALTRDGDVLYAAAAFGHSIGRFDAGSGKFLGEIALEPESYPYGVVLDESRRRLYVSLWSKARVAVVDTDSFKVVALWPAQEHPNEMILTRGGKFLFVANANRNTVTVIDALAGKPIETIGTAIDPRAPAGSTPNSLALSPDESMLFVANANTNNLAVVNVKEPGASAPLGFIPVGWYPTSVRVDRAGPDDLCDQRQRCQLARQSRWAASWFSRIRQLDARVYRRPFPGHAVADSHARPQEDGRLFANRLRL